MRQHVAPAGPPPTVLVFAPRERTRTLARDTFPRRRWRLVVRRTVDEFGRAFHEELIDAAIVDLGAAHEENWQAAALAREYPSVPFFALTTLRAADGPVLAQCAALEFADVLVEDVDEEAIRELVQRQAYTTRFTRALGAPPESLALTTELQVGAWRYVVNHAGRPVRTAALADSLGVTREHLSRTFSADGAPNLKRIIDLVRVIGAAELAKNPGYDVRDVARVLGFASSSHLSSTAQRIAGTRPASLARLRAVDLVERFNRGHARSRG
ncbi:MAG: helix-turn-helix domain-containing protein [Gemmatimonadota bacterium]|nr:helix-turn-helix domain-containing protein [Gemmatimonadota bacterium]